VYRGAMGMPESVRGSRESGVGVLLAIDPKS